MFNKYNQIHRAEVDVENTTAAYAAQESIGGLLEFDVDVGTGVQVFGATIRDIILREIGTQAAAMNLYLFGEKPKVILDHASVDTLDTADYDMMSVGNGTSLDAGLYKSLTSADDGDLRRLAKPNVNIDVKLVPADPTENNKFWGYLVPQGAVTFPVADVLKLSLDHWID